MSKQPKLEDIGPWQARVVPGQGSKAVIFLHGFGAPGNDLVPFADVFGSYTENLHFVFPQAPNSLSAMGGMGAFFGDARAWWMIDTAALEREMARGGHRDLSKECPEELPALREQFAGFLDALADKLGVSEVVLGGFSQGAMMVMDYALHAPADSKVSISGLILFSTTYLCEKDWAPRIKEHSGLPVFQSHGQSDPLLPFEAAARLRMELESAGWDNDFVAFPGGHEIPPPVLAGAIAMLQKALDSKAGPPLTDVESHT